MKPTFGPAPIRPFPYVEGQTRRIKAEPTKLTGVALRVMAASGNFTTRRTSAPSLPGLWFGALALLLTAGAIAVTNSDALTGDRSSGRAAAASSSPLPDQVQSPGASERVPFVALATVPVQEAARASELDPQDRFEIERFHRWAAATASDLAPAAGSVTR